MNLLDIIQKIEKEKNYINVVKIMRNTDNVEIVKHFLNSHHIDEKFCERKVMSAFMIYYHPDDILEEEKQRTFFEKAIFSVSKTLIDTLYKKENTPQYSELLKKKYNQFVKIFNLWKDKDCQHLLEVLATSYQNLTNTLKDLNNLSDEIKNYEKSTNNEKKKENSHSSSDDFEFKSLKQEIVPRINDIIKKARSLGYTENDLREFKQSKDKNLEIPKSDSNKSEELNSPIQELNSPIQELNSPIQELNSPIQELNSPIQEDDEIVNENLLEGNEKESPIVKEVKKTMEKAFWDSFAESIEKGETKHLGILLTEVATKLKKLTPNRKDLHQEIDDKIDPSFISQLINGGSFDSQMFYSLAEFIVLKIIELQSPVSNNKTRKWYSDFVKDCSNKQYHEILPSFFNRVNIELDVIQKECNIIKEELQKKSTF